MKIKLSSILLLSVPVIVCLTSPRAFATVTGTAHDFSPGGGR